MIINILFQNYAMGFTPNSVGHLLIENMKLNSYCHLKSPVFQSLSGKGEIYQGSKSGFLKTAHFANRVVRK